MNIQVASSHHGKYNTEPTGSSSLHGKYRANGVKQPSRKIQSQRGTRSLRGKKQSLWQNRKMELCQRTEKNSSQALARDTKNIGDIEDIPNTELKIHLLHRTGAAVFMKIHAAASYFSFKIVIIISYMKCCFGAAKTDCTDIGFLK